MTAQLVVETGDGTITVPEAVLEGIVRRAANAVEGARVRRPRRGLELSVEAGHAAVSLELAARHGSVLPVVARAVQERVAGALETMCLLEVDRVDLSIEELDG